MAVINDFQVNGMFPSVVGGTGATVKYFPRLLGTSIGVQSVAPSATSAVGQLAVPGGNELNGQWFDVQCGGNIIAGNSDSSTNVEVALYAQTSAVLTSPAYTKIATTGPVGMPYSNQAYGWGLRVQLLGENKSGVVRGLQQSYVGSAAFSVPATLTASLSNINFLSGASAALQATSGGAGTAGGYMVAFGLVVGVTFTDSDAANSASLYQFTINAH